MRTPSEMVREAISRLSAGDVAGANWLTHAAYEMTSSPEAPDATDETRLAAGWKQQVVQGDGAEPPPGRTATPDGWTPAPGGAGPWRYQGSVALGCVWVMWLRWLVPVEVPRG